MGQRTHGSDKIADEQVITSMCGEACLHGRKYVRAAAYAYSVAQG